MHWRQTTLQTSFSVRSCQAFHLALDEILDASWSEYDYTLDVPRGPSQAELQQKQKREEAMRKLYADLTEHYKSLTDELG